MLLSKKKKWNIGVTFVKVNLNNYDEKDCFFKNKNKNMKPVTFSARTKIEEKQNSLYEY